MPLGEGLCLKFDMSRRYNEDSCEQMIVKAAHLSPVEVCRDGHYE